MKLERRESAAIIAWHRPAVRNAFDPPSLQALHGLIERAARSDARCIVLHGEGGHFSAGDDVRASVKLDAHGWERMNATWARLVHSIVCAPQPVIAAADGVCLGGAFQLACCCDVLLVAPTATLGCPEVLVGLSPFNGFTGLAPRSARAAILTGELLTAEDVHRLGLAWRIADDPLAEALSMAERVARSSPTAIAGVKRVLTVAEMPALAAALQRETRLSSELFAADGQEGMRAFLEKRPPRFAPWADARTSDEP